MARRKVRFDAEDNGAQPMYYKQLARAKAALAELEAYLVAGDAHPIPACAWGAAGDMGHVAEVLEQAANFIGGRN